MAAVAAFGQSAAYDRGIAAFKAKAYSEAIPLLAQAEAASQGATDALLYEGKAFSNLGTFSQAEKVLRLFTDRHPRSTDGTAFLGHVRFREDKPRDSLDYYNRAAKLATPWGDGLKIVALDYVLLNDLKDATR